MASASMSLVSPAGGPLQQRLPSPSSVAPPLSAFSRRARTSVIFSHARTPALLRIVCCSSAGSSPSSAAVAVAVSNGRPDGERREVRFGLPSKGRMAEDTLGLLKDCQLSVKQLGPKFMKENGLKHVSFSTGEGALEAAPAMGTADVILDLVSSGTTLKENNLKEIEGGTVLESQAVLVASRKSLIQREGVLGATHEILERLEAHLKAVGQFTVTANMRGSSAEEVAKRVLSQPSLSGLQGPTVSPVFRKCNGEVVVDYYAIVICVPKRELYSSVQQLRAIGGSGVLVSPLTYIFDEETPRWQQLLSKLGPR